MKHWGVALVLSSLVGSVNACLDVTTIYPIQYPPDTTEADGGGTEDGDVEGNARDAGEEETDAADTAIQAADGV